MYIRLYQRTGNPGIISGVIHEGKSIANNGMLYLKTHVKRFCQFHFDKVIFFFQF